jgi:hypothetical protein
MAQRHIASTGSNTSPYDTWAKAATTAETAITGSAAGDDFLFDKAHSQSGGAVVLTFPGTISNPNRVLCGTPDTVSGLVDIATGAVVTGTTSVTVNGCVKVHALKLVCSNNSANEMLLGSAIGSVQEWTDCTFQLSGTSNSSTVRSGNNTAGEGSMVRLVRPIFQFAVNGQRYEYAGRAFIINETRPTSTPTQLVAPYSNGKGGWLTAIACDYTACGNSFNFFGDGQGGNVGEFFHPTVPSAWAGLVETTANSCPGFSARVYNLLKSGGATLRVRTRTVSGDIEDETTIVASGGVAADSVGSYSLKFIGTSSVSPRLARVYSDWMSSAVNSTTGATVNLWGHFIHNGANVKDDEFGIEVLWPDGTWQTSEQTAPLTAATDLASSSITWSSSPSGTPVKQKAGVSRSPTKAGPIAWRYWLAANRTIYGHPILEIA